MYSMELENKYPMAYNDVMKGNLRYAWDSLSCQSKEEILVDINKNAGYNNG